MTVTLDLSPHQNYINDLITVSKTDGVSGSISSISNCIMLKIDVDEKEESLGIYQGWLSEIHSPTILVIGDTIIYGVTTYRVIKTIPPVMSDPYQATLLNLGFYRFDNTVQHYRPNWIKDSYGTDTNSGYTLIEPAIECRIQPIKSEPKLIQGKRIQLNHFDIFLLDNINTLRSGDIFRSVANNQDFRIISFEHSQSITDLMSVKCTSDWEQNI